MALIISLIQDIKAQQPYSSTLVINAAAGDPSAQADLAGCYLLGNGVEKNVNEAVRLFKLAADKSNDSALIMLGVMYLNGENVEQDPVQGERYLLKAAERGNAIAQMYLGDFYARGFRSQKTFIPPDKKKSEKWFKEAEQQGFYSKKRVDSKETSIPEGSQVLSFDPKSSEEDTKKLEEWGSKEIKKIQSEGVKEIQNDINRAMDKISTEADSLKKQAVEKVLESEKKKIEGNNDNATNPQ